VRRDIKPDFQRCSLLVSPLGRSHLEAPFEMLSETRDIAVADTARNQNHRQLGCFKQISGFFESDFLEVSLETHPMLLPKQPGKISRACEPNGFRNLLQAQRTVHSKRDMRGGSLKRRIGLPERLPSQGGFTARFRLS